MLFNELKLSAKGLKKTKSGFSTDADTLEKLAAAHPMPRKLIEYRTVTKLKSTYADALTELIDRRTGRIHTTFHQASDGDRAAELERPQSAKYPDPQRRGTAHPPRVLAARRDVCCFRRIIRRSICGCWRICRATRRWSRRFGSGEDIHVRTAAEVLGITPDKVDAEARRLAKVINFGIIYGMGPQRLAGELGIPLAEASDYIKRYFERLPGVRACLDETVRNARETGYVATMYGRRRYLPELARPTGRRAGAGRADRHQHADSGHVPPT